jgi:mRNA deadenylase 3'-5' endonuclease subunit Ccr4
LVSHVEYGNTLLEHIEWKNRLPQIQKEIMWTQAHIVCLQEVEGKSEIIEFLRGKGYEGSMMKKPHPDRHDGPATFYDASRFDLEKKFELPYAYKVGSGSKGGMGLYEKGNCCLILALRSKE